MMRENGRGERGSRDILVKIFWEKGRAEIGGFSVRKTQAYS